MTLTPSSGLSPDSSPSDAPLLVEVASGAFAGSIKWWGYGLSIAGFALGLFIEFWPGGLHPAWQAVLASILVLTIPLVVLGLVLYSPASFEVGRLKRRGVNGLVALPFVALLASNLYHAQVDPFWPALPGALAAAVVLPLAWNVRNAPGLANPTWMLTVVTLCAAVFGYGATAVADIRFDLSPGDVTSVQVLDKHVFRGRHSHSYHLDLPAWGPRTGPNSIEVSWSTYRAVNVGDKVCITLHPGAVGLPWFTSAACSGADRSW